MFGGLDKALQAPGKIAREAAKATAQLPAVPFDVADQARRGLEEGIEKVTDPEPRRK